MSVASPRDQDEKKRHPWLRLIIPVVALVFLLVGWKLATVSESAQPSFVPGPIWLLRYDVLQRIYGITPVIYLAVSLLVNLLLVTGMFVVFFRRTLLTIILSFSCLFIWLSCGIMMRQVIEATLPLEPIADQPNLPRVLLIGDSISIGYTLHVRQLLAGQANIHHPPTNCASTRIGLKQIDNWLGNGRWDVIHFNWGLHDMRLVKDVQTGKRHPLVPVDEYKQNLRRLVGRLKATEAKLIWQSTTPVPLQSIFCDPGTVSQYNQVAAVVMSEHNIPINDLFEFATPQLDEIQKPLDIHFTYQGSKRLAEQVARVTGEALNLSVLAE